MLRAVVADSHLGQVDGDLERFAALAAEMASRGVGEAIFLGDLHRSLVGFERFWDDTARAVLELLAGLRRRGIRVVLIEGNRDFFLDSRDLDRFRDAVGGVHSFAAGGRRFLLEHGDLVNRRDRAYRFWRAVSKSGAARIGARLLPRRIARRLVSDTERRLAQTNFSYRRVLPVDDLTVEARRHFASGVDVVLWGHFHRPWVYMEGGRQARVVPAWAETGAVVWVASDGDARLTESGAEGQFIDTTDPSWYQEWRGPEATR